MPATKTGTRRGRPPRPAALKRSEWLEVRLSPLELEAAKARAEAAGLELSSYVRLQVCGTAPERRLADKPPPPDPLEAEMRRVRAEQPGLPAASVRILARRRLAQR